MAESTTSIRIEGTCVISGYAGLGYVPMQPMEMAVVITMIVGVDIASGRLLFLARVPSLLRREACLLYRLVVVQECQLA